MLSRYLVPLAILSHGLVAGTFFAFSTYVMSALDGTDASTAAKAMQSINLTIVRSPFIVLFMLSALLAVGLPIYAAASGQRGSVLPLAVSGALYIFGVFTVTTAFNVPLNDKLAAIQAQEFGTYWKAYLAAWMPWNHVRTACSIASTAVLIWTQRA